MGRNLNLYFYVFKDISHWWLSCISTHHHFTFDGWLNCISTHHHILPFQHFILGAHPLVLIATRWPIQAVSENVLHCLVWVSTRANTGFASSHFLIFPSVAFALFLVSTMMGFFLFLFYFHDFFTIENFFIYNWYN